MLKKVSKNQESIGCSKRFLSIFATFEKWPIYYCFPSQNFFQLQNNNKWTFLRIFGVRKVEFLLLLLAPRNFFSRNFRTPKNFGVRKFLNFSGFWDFGLRKFSYSENFLRKNFGLHGFSKIWAMLSRKNFPMDTKNCQKCSSLGIKWDTKKNAGRSFLLRCAPARGRWGPFL